MPRADEGGAAAERSEDKRETDWTGWKPEVILWYYERLPDAQAGRDFERAEVATPSDAHD